VVPEKQKTTKMIEKKGKGEKSGKAVNPFMAIQKQSTDHTHALSCVFYSRRLFFSIFCFILGSLLFVILLDTVHNQSHHTLSTLLPPSSVSSSSFFSVCFVYDCTAHFFPTEELMMGFLQHRKTNDVPQKVGPTPLHISPFRFFFLPPHNRTRV
jgi:hypothetical protein